MPDGRAQFLIRSRQSLDQSYRRGARLVRGGFSLVEMMVIISVILLLIGVLLTTGWSPAAEKQTVMILAQAKAIAKEYQLQSDSTTLSHHDTATGSPYNWTVAKAVNARGASGTALANDTIERFVWAAMQYKIVREMLYALGEDVFQDSDGDGFMEIVDGWGRKLEYAQAVSHSDSEGGDDFLPEHQWPFFASPGEDGVFGDAENGDPAELPLRGDHYSFERN